MRTIQHLDHPHPGHRCHHAENSSCVHAVVWITPWNSRYADLVDARVDAHLLVLDHVSQIKLTQTGPLI